MAYEDFKKFVEIVDMAEKLCGKEVVKDYFDTASSPFNFDGYVFEDVRIYLGHDEIEYVSVDDVSTEEYIKYFVLTEEIAEELCKKLQSLLPVEPLKIGYSYLEELISTGDIFLDIVYYIYDKYIDKSKLELSELRIMGLLRVEDNICCLEEVRKKYADKILLYGFDVEGSIIYRPMRTVGEAIEALKLVNVEVVNF